MTKPDIEELQKELAQCKRDLLEMQELAGDAVQEHATEENRSLRLMDALRKIAHTNVDLNRAIDIAKRAMEEYDASE